MYSVLVPRSEIRQLTGLRAVAAAWVVVAHFQGTILTLLPGLGILTPQFSQGFLGVEVFFVLSGFVISYTYSERLAPFTGMAYRRYLLARFSRIYPVHLATIGIVGALVIGASVVHVTLNTPGQFTLPNFVSNIFLLQQVPPFSPVNVPAWSICTEAVAYLCLPLVLSLYRLFTTKWAAFVAAMTILVIGALLMFSMSAALDLNPTDGGLPWLRILFEFPAGVLLFAAWDRAQRPTSKLFDTLAGAAALITLVLAGVLQTGATGRGLIVAPLLALVVLGVAGSRGIVARFLASAPMRWLGKLSYSVYMTHFIVLLVLRKIIPPQQFLTEPVATRIIVFVLYVALVIGAGAITYYTVEAPARNLINSSMRKHDRTMRSQKRQP